MMQPIPSDACFDLIKQFEGLRLTPYRDLAGFWTVGWGHKLPDVPATLAPITEQQAENDLDNDVMATFQAMCSLVTVRLTQGQVDALTSFVFNLGAERLKESTLLRKLNMGQYAEIPAEIERWIYAGGNEQAGLIARRHAEAELWSSA